jgi:hypothetical protein
MLTKVNELNRNAIVLLSVLILAVTSLAIAFMVIGQSSDKSSAQYLEDFQKAFISEYGVNPTVNVSVYGVNEAQAKTITETMSSKLGLTDAIAEESDGSTWYTTEDKKKDINVTAFYE